MLLVVGVVSKLERRGVAMPRGIIDPYPSFGRDGK